MIGQRLIRPSLRIIGRVEPLPGDAFTVAVWNPFARAYQSVASVEEGVRRIRALADLIRYMLLRRHPKLDLLEDVPAADTSQRARWAEVRINPTTDRRCETRQDDRPGWVHAAGMTRATGIIYARVGCSPGVSNVS